MSHYGVNAGVPKTLIQHIIQWVISEEIFDHSTQQVLTAILNQEISPELVPSIDGKTMQSTEAIIGPYALNDFFLYHLLRGDRPSRIAYLAWNAWCDSTRGTWPVSWAEDRLVSYSLGTIRGWLGFFLKRFFANQFKRSAIPDGPKVSRGGSLSPRQEWVMPSDVTAETWLRELEENLPKESEGA
jgi:NAD+ synthase (glutamine-hydrolysing)